MMKRREPSFINDLTRGNATRQLISFTIPFVFVNLLQMAYGLVDMIIVGQAVGSVGLSAVANGSEMLMMFTIFGMSFANAGQIIISQFVGSDNSSGRYHTIGTMLSVTMAFAAISTFVGFFGAGIFLDWLNIPPEARQQALEYLQVGSLGIVFIFGYNTVGCILRGMGDSKRPLIFVVIATVVNVVLDLFFIMGLGWGAKGAALATVIGQGVSFLWALGYLYKNREQLGFDFKPRGFIPTKNILGMLVRLGIPSMLQFFAISVSMLYVVAQINAFGVAASAVSGVGNKLTSFAVVISGALSMSGSTMIGQNLGAGKPDRAAKVVNLSFLFGLISSAPLCVIIFFFPEQVFRIWTNDTVVLAMAPMYVPIAILNFISFAVRSPMMALINGMGFASLSFACGILDGVVLRIGLAMLLGFGLNMGIEGYWYGSALAGFTHLVVVLPYYLSGRWKTRKLITQTKP
jgi:putative MATE family efflux protein